MLLARALAVWLVLIAGEVVQGIVRTLWLAPWLGDFRARQIGVFLGSAQILTISSLTSRWLRARTVRSQLTIGSLWLLLTVTFEFTLGLQVLRFSWRRMVSDYNLRRGGLLPVGLAVLTLSPYITARLGPNRHSH
jgi:hypothetical protein